MFPLSGSGLLMQCFRSVLAIGVIAQTASAQAKREPVDVCTVLSNVRAYSGKVIEIKGQFEFARHAHYLFSEHCRARIVLDGNDPNLRPQVSFISNTEGIDRMIEILRKRKPKVKLVATVQGEFRVKESYSRPLVQDGVASGIGFCHVGLFPVALVVKSVLSYQELF
jgi:hypothetical protein